VGLDLLERIASGRADEVTDESGAQVGVQAGLLRGPDFKATTVRACALVKIGESGLPEAMDFLTGLRPSELLRQDSGGEMLTARAVAMLGRSTDSQGQVAYLVGTVRELLNLPVGADWKGPPSGW
jgi:hypothetical protein